ncbi:MAG: hypothetical protein ABR503_12135 [Chitinophagaceae bacterium]
MKYLLLFSFVFIFSFVKAQTRTDVKIYGYIQPVSSGVSPPVAIDEEGNVSSRGIKRGSNYFIYLTGPASVRIYPIEMWVNGEPYSAKPETINKTPIEKADPSFPDGPKKITLVPKTTKKVMMLVPGTASFTNKSLANAKSLAKTNELVVVYKMNGKLYYSLLKKLQTIERADMQ